MVDEITRGPGLRARRSQLFISTRTQTPFRSRLEAAWADTLDHLGIIWEYEPQVVTLQDGRRYLPDFWLPQLKTILEVKGAHLERLDKALMYARLVRGEWLVIVGFTYYRPEPHRYRMVFAGAIERAGFARCQVCDAWGWVPERPRMCRACGAPVADHSFYRVDTAPFWPAP